MWTGGVNPEGVKRCAAPLISPCVGGMGGRVSWRWGAYSIKQYRDNGACAIMTEEALMRWGEGALLIQANPRRVKWIGLMTSIYSVALRRCYGGGGCGGGEAYQSAAKGTEEIPIRFYIHFSLSWALRA